MTRTIRAAENVMARRTLFLPLALSALVVLALGGPLPAQQDEDPGRFNAVFLSMASPEEPAKLAAQWTGDPSTQLELWVDFDGDGIWSESEKMLEGAALAEEIVVFDIALPPGFELLPELNARFRISGDMPLERVQRIGDAEPAASSALPARGSAPGEGPERCEWASGFHVQGMDATVSASVVFDDGSGPTLYVGGAFVSADNVVVNGIAKWDGTAWTAVGPGMDDTVNALAVHDDGTGAALYAGGRFTAAGGVSARHIAKWDGTAWTPLGSGMNTWVLALTVFDDGTGTALYAGGEFEFAGGERANRIAKWDGTTWTPLETGLNRPVRALTVYDDGTGAALYAGGDFTTADGMSANRIAKWDGTAWTPLGLGMNRPVRALTVYDDGAGAQLYAGGDFTSIGELRVNLIAKWDGTAWTAVGSGVNRSVSALTVYDDGTGAALYAGGGFTNAGGVNANRIAKWDGTAWAILSGISQSGNGTGGHVRALTVHDDGTGAALYAGGDFTTAGGMSAGHIATWDGTAWAIPSDMQQSGNGTREPVRVLAVYDEGTGAALYAGGDFITAGGVSANRIAKWDGTAWTDLGAGMDRSVQALTVYDDGTGAALYAGGDFTNADGVSANRIAKWDGTAWTDLGAGMNGPVKALTVHDDGTGAALYVGGGFTTAGVMSANRIAKWDGTAWTALGSGMNRSVSALAVHDDGTGAALYAGGEFTNADGVSANRIAKWDGTVWTALGFGLNREVWALTVYDDGTGAALYAGGDFTNAGGVNANRIAKWDGTAWTAMGSGLNDEVYALTVYDEGTGTALYAGGDFTNAGGVSANRIAKWDGTAWLPIESGMDSRVNALTVLDDGAVPALYVGGFFSTAGELASTHFAKYSCGPNLSLPPLIEIAAGATATLPIHLILQRSHVASTSFSVDYDQSCLNPDVDGDGNLDGFISNVPADFTVTTLFDPVDTDGEIDISIADASEPIATLGTGDLLSIDFQATCTGSPITPIDAPVKFSLDPSPTFGGADNQIVPGTWSDGIVRIWPGQRGDCDASGALDAQDFTAIGLEIFDADGDFWTDAPASDFVGSPVGCDANANTQIRAADVVCANILTLAGTCSGDNPLGGTSPRIIIQGEQMPGELVWIRAEALQMQSVAGLAFSLELDPAQFDLAGVDVDGNGVPDHLRYPQGEPDFGVVLWSSADAGGKLDVLLADLSSQALAEGVLVEIGIPVADEWSEQGIALSQAPAPSFGSTTGSDLAGSASVYLGLFSDDFESGDFTRWSSVME